jgi:hypothetical protein
VTELDELLSSRSPAYRLAEVAVGTDRLDPEAVVEAILHEIESGETSREAR